MKDLVEAPARGAPDYDVAIVGYGPTGATLANLLALRGMKVVVFERDKDMFALPRAVHFDGECMRVFQTIGIAEALLPNLCVAPGMRFVNARDELLLDWSRPQGIGPQGWCASYKFHQPDLERTLRAQLATTGRADVRLRHEVFALDERDDHVRIRFEDTAHGRLVHTTARYVVGCDGARSMVRRFIGTELADLKSHERWVVVDVLLERERPDLGDYSVQYCDPARPITYTRGPHNRRRWEIMVMPGDDERGIGTTAWIWERLARWVTPADAQLERSAVYTFHSVIAQGWRRGRLLIAGDAAHQTPPFMGQGMAAGIRDASNLAWKLADVIRGELPETVLDSYESERAPHVREFIETAVQLGRVIQTTDQDAVAARDREMTTAIREFRTPQPRLGVGWHVGEPGGHVGPQPVFGDGARFDDAVGYRFALVVDASMADQVRAPLSAEQRERVAVVAASGEVLQAWLDAQAARAILLRPDRYVGGVAHDFAGVVRLLAHAGLEVAGQRSQAA
ncbi:bifunctional 3-(3-hydroxy-phenyl)propionate/3-hydroxycinnamic acid hydroxylase [Paraburkholderia tagetis]|uniref:Bifunctional 3-(3-hydroxy-phenyl)propionate/3-hydroxycinnamic acid hydroxylase n=1 Tax=Paraburkholderia tagetis TaxID=2913261 RepID=A0A9X1RKN6_9BURK|nr:bifunctional 3-(3-hydroxy-phenyl)propionate/3-hydroxycinnamic acid hydroxylase [Paraburkholderia tagetis]MCG5073153.1 bifunctional 3-(3-hydroxy-phenyl)propionate/3-hydroxycinnamic acid hydroxylase [Paraburkholderia tagetis]